MTTPATKTSQTKQTEVGSMRSEVVESRSKSDVSRLRILMASPPKTAPGPLPKHTPILVDALRSFGCLVETTDWGNGGGRASAARRALSRASQILGVWSKAGRGSSDVVIIKTAHDWATLSRDVPLMLGLRLIAPIRIIQFHGSRPDGLLRRNRPLFRLTTRVLLASASGILVLSSEERRLWAQFRPKTKILVVKNPHLARDDERRPENTGGSRRLVVLFVGRLLLQKGVLDLVEAAGILARSPSGLSFEIVMAGEGPESGSILARSRELGIEDRVRLVGYVDSKALGGLYDQATLLVLPSYSEGFPTVIAEAMAAGLPIVTTKIRGAADYLEEGINALFVSPGDSDQLAEALRRLLEDPGLCERMGKQNSEKVHMFAPDKVAIEYLDALTQIGWASVQTLEDQPSAAGRKFSRQDGLK